MRMEQLRGPGARAITLLAGLALVVAACASDDNGGATPGSPATSPDSSPAGSPAESPDGSGTGFEFEDLGGSVSVVGSWAGAEQDSFMAMVAPWEEGTGATVNYTGSRDLSAQLSTGIASGNLPDLAGLPGPGLMKEWYDQGALQPLDFIDVEGYRSATPAGFAELGEADDGALIGIFTKAAVKGLIFYNTSVWTGDAPGSWDELQTAADGVAEGDTATWCIGFESGAASGWPGTDWIEDIVLRQAGPDVYDAWVVASRSGPRRRSGRRSRRSGMPWTTRTAARRTWSTRTSARRRTRCSTIRPAACSTTRRASSPTSSRMRPAPRKATTTSS
jgi:ABC-type glycerol-3-phosphate transport system substrate-binding protein